jgi:L-serine kinase (ADP)
MKRIVNLPVETLVCHENVDKRKVEALVLEISKTRVLRHPIVVEKDTRLVLDGHHRLAAFKALNMKNIPSQVISYDRIYVKIRRPVIEQAILKAGIIRYILEGNIFPVKTTKHRLPKEILESIPINIDTIDSKVI